MTADEILQQIENQVKRIGSSQDKDYAFIKKYGVNFEGIETNELLNRFTKILLGNMEDFFTHIGFNLSESVVISILPLNDINAFATKAEDKYIVVLNSKLLALISGWFELDILGIRKLEDGNDQRFANFLEPVLEVYFNPLASEALPVVQWEGLSSLEWSIVYTRTLMCERFILAHELAHIYLGHVDSRNEPSMFWKTYYAQTENQAKEFEADIQAFRWLQSLPDDDLLPVKKNNLFMLYFEVFYILNYIECNTRFPSENSDHPSAIARLNNLREEFAFEELKLGDYSLDDMLENLKDIESFRINHTNN